MTRETLGQIVLRNVARYDEAVRTGIWPEVPAWSQRREQSKRRAKKPADEGPAADDVLY
jgi:hypothetical protein